MSWRRPGGEYAIARNQPVRFAVRWSFSWMVASIPGYELTGTGPGEDELRAALEASAGLYVTTLDVRYPSGLTQTADVTAIAAEAVSVAELRRQVLEAWSVANELTSWMYRGSSPAVLELEVSVLESGAADTSGEEPSQSIGEWLRENLGLGGDDSESGAAWSTAVLVLGVAACGYVAWRLFRDVREATS